MNTTDDKPFRVFEKQNYSVLEAAAKELGIDITISEDIRVVEELFQHGILTYGAEQGRSPIEQVYIQQLLPAILDKNRLPAELQVYLVDRGYLKNTPETIGTLLFREQEKTRHEFIEAVHGLANIVREQEK